MADALARTILVSTHGRYLVSRPAAVAGAVPAPLAGVLMGFHGQGETAATQLQQMSRVAGTRPWLLVSVQALHRYNTRHGDIAACWMTREDRELVIADNVAYVRAVIDAVRGELLDEPRPDPRPDPMADPSGAEVVPAAGLPLVFIGFSQGASMAYRAAAFTGRPSAGVIALAGDLPPDVVPVAGSIPPVLIGRGIRDAWFTEAKARQNLLDLTAAGIAATEYVFADGHVWHESFIARAGQVLDATSRPRDHAALS